MIKKTKTCDNDNCSFRKIIKPFSVKAVVKNNCKNKLCLTQWVGNAIIIETVAFGYHSASQGHNYSVLSHMHCER